MNNPGIKEEVWNSLMQKWSTLVDKGHTLKVEFMLLKDPEDESKALGIDVAQNIDGEWHVQTVQNQLQSAYSAVGINGLELDQLIHIVGHTVNTVTKPIIGRETYDDEMHLFMKHISSETSELFGYVILKTGEKIGIRTNYRHYYVVNEILEQVSKIMKDEYAEMQLHRNRDDNGKIYFRFIPRD